MSEENTISDGSEPRKASSSSCVSTDIMSSFDVGEITESPDEESLSISAILHYCKCKILRPYLRLLAMMGLRPLPIDPPEPYSCLAVIGYIHLGQVLLLMCVGYVLQYMSCFRRDRGFYYNKKTSISNGDHEQICYGSIMFSYIVPSMLHLVAFVYTVFLFRLNQNEQLKNLMERVFLLSSNPSDGSASQRKLVYRLWMFIALSIIWMILSLISVTVMMTQGTIMFQWIEHSSQGVKLTMKVLLTVATLWHDMVQATIITSYCLQGQLLTSHLHFLRAKLLQHTIIPLDWIREIGEFRKLLRYLNEDLAPAVCIFTIVNVSWAASGTVWLLKYDTVDKATLPIIGISVLNVLLWALISLAPFIQGWLFHLTEKMKTAGQNERRLAIERGDVVNGVPFITVIVDGGWSKRSYGHSFSAASGVVVIIGAHTNKILYLGVKNKYCLTCARSKAASLDTPKHECYLNFKGSSTAMEQKAIVEGFNCSMEQHGVIYKYMVGDGDSSVFARVQTCVAKYGRTVEKRECANHIIRCYRLNLQKIRSNTKLYELEARKMLTKHSIERITKGARAAIRNCARNATALKEDLLNGPLHVFGSHLNCKDNYCTKKNSIKLNLVPLLKDSKVWKEAACVTNACSKMQGVGHEVRGRPFVYQDTPGEDLDTILLYTSSLRMNAKLFRVPITGRYLCLALTVGAVLVLTLGQCHIL